MARELSSVEPSHALIVRILALYRESAQKVARELRATHMVERAMLSPGLGMAASRRSWMGNLMGFLEVARRAPAVDGWLIASPLC